MGGSDSTKLVYSTDPALNVKCPKCGELKLNCVCVPDEDVSGYKFVAILRIEKSGRAGKTVTVVDGLPKNGIFLKELTAELKKKCGSGGTFLMDRKEGVIEIQGDKRDLIRAALAKKGIKHKG